MLSSKKSATVEGVITGEHGIGIAKKPCGLPPTTPAVRDLHRKIKQALDPKGLLNPGKFLGFRESEFEISASELRDQAFKAFVGFFPNFGIGWS